MPSLVGFGIGCSKQVFFDYEKVLERKHIILGMCGIQQGIKGLADTLLADKWPVIYHCASGNVLTPASLPIRLYIWNPVYG